MREQARSRHGETEGDLGVDPEHHPDHQGPCQHRKWDGTASTRNQAEVPGPSCLQGGEAQI